jgi:hypothetical protein
LRRSLENGEGTLPSFDAQGSAPRAALAASGQIVVVVGAFPQNESGSCERIKSEVGHS